MDPARRLYECPLPPDKPLINIPESLPFREASPGGDTGAAPSPRGIPGYPGPGEEVAVDKRLTLNAVCGDMEKTHGWE